MIRIIGYVNVYYGIDASEERRGEALQSATTVVVRRSIYRKTWLRNKLHNLSIYIILLTTYDFSSSRLCRVDTTAAAEAEAAVACGPIK